MKLKNVILQFVNSPENGIKSSQTLYECLFFAVNRWRQTGTTDWLRQCEKVALEIVQDQLPDGGFDIGYDFIFGKGLRKKSVREGTSPELLSVTALGLFVLHCGQQVSDSTNLKVRKSLDSGVEWIFRYLKEQPDGSFAIPYAPLSHEGIHITNATSFALSALAVASVVSESGKKDELTKAVKLMYRFMSSQLVPASGRAGMLWPYFFRGAEDEGFSNDKIDNYHIAQQLYHHCLAQQYVPDSSNLEIIEQVGGYLVNLQDDEGFVPYTFAQGRISDKVDVWGFSALVPAFAEAAKYLKNPDLENAVLRGVGYLFRHCVSEKNFYPIILNSGKKVFDSHFYPRSDAWVIHALSCVPDCLSDAQNKFCDSIFYRIAGENFSGLENHTLTNKKALFAKLVYLIRR